MAGWGSKTALTVGKYAPYSGAINGKIYVVGGYSGGYTNSTYEYDPVTGTNTQKAAVPGNARSFGVSGVINGKLYAVGGFDGTNYLGTNYEYDPVANTWSSKASMTGRRMAGAAVADGKLYVFGGVVSGGVYLATHECYDPVTNTWVAKAAMPVATNKLGTAAVGQKIYAIGGLVSAGATAAVYEYDTTTNTWTAKQSMGIARSGLTCAVVKGKIYAIGGDASPLTYNQVYDPLTDTWLLKSPMSTGRYDLVSAVINDVIYTIGGRTATEGSVGSTVVESYDPDLDGQAWTTKAAMPTARRGVAAATLNGKIYAVGGQDAANAYVGTNEMYDPALDTWTAKAAMASASSLGALAATGGKLYHIAGYNGSVLTRMYEYDPTANTWATKASLPGTRYDIYAAVLDGKIYVPGGYNSGATLTMYCYDPATDTWTTKANMPETKFYAVPVSVNGLVYVIGGSGGTTNAVYAFNPATNTWSSKVATPVALDQGNAVALKGLIYYFGGTQAAAAYGTGIYVYDPATDLWGKKASTLSVGRSIAGIAALNDVAFLIGGQVSGGGSSALNEMYDPRFDPWTTRKAMPTARQFAGGATHNGKIYVIGGTTGTNSAANEMYDPALDTWTTKAPASNSRHGSFIGTIGDKIYQAGGYSTGSTQQTYAYDPVANTWSSALASMPNVKHLGGSAVLNGKLYAIGGGTASVYEYDPTATSVGTWTTKTAVPQVYSTVQAAAVGGLIYWLADTGVLYAFDPVANTHTQKKNIPTTLANMGTTAIVLGTTIIFTGSNVSGASKLVFAYDTLTDTWKQLPDMPTARSATANVALNGKGYVIGGLTTAVTAVVEEIAPNDNPTVQITSPVGTPSQPGGTPLPAVIRWRFSDPEGLPQAQFLLTLYNADNNQQIHTIKTSSAAEQYTVPDGVLVLGGRYYGELTVWDATGLTGSSERFYFITSQVPTVSNPRPSGTQVVPGGGSMTPRLQLDYFDPEGGAISKSQWVLIDTNGATIHDSGEIVSTNPFYDVPAAANLQAGQIYGWKGGFADNHGVWSEYTAVQYFITNNMPSALTPNSPADTYRTCPRPVFVATIGDDVENDGQNFVLQIADDQGFTVGLQEFSSATAPVGWEAKTTVGSFAPITGDGVTSAYEGGQVRYTMQTDLVENQKYYWRMAPVDASSGATGTWSTARTIRVGDVLQVERNAVLTGNVLAERVLINLLSVIAADGTTPAELKVEITNNGLDASPVWEEATQAVLLGNYHTFTNTTKTAAEGAVICRITVQANDSLDTIEILDVAYSFD